MIRSLNMSGALSVLGFKNNGVLNSPLTATDSPAVTGSVESEAFRITADVDIHFAVGSNPVANTNCPVLTSGCSEVILCSKQDKVSIIKKTAQPDGQVWIHAVKET